MKDMLKRQKFLDEKIITERGVNPEILDRCRALQHEVMEIEDELNWKWWKQPKKVSTEKLKEEWIDAFHFMLSIALMLNMDEVEIKKRYFAKNAVNIKRQKDDY